MNIFILDENIKKSAQYHVDRHVVKMPLELGQMVSTTYHVLNYKDLPDFIFKKASYINHPCSKWVRENYLNFQYACNLGLALYDEYQYRYNKPDKMQRVKKIFEWAKNNPPLLRDIRISDVSKFALAMPEKYKYFDAVKSYRHYYCECKSHLFSWKKRKKPEWIKI